MVTWFRRELDQGDEGPDVELVQRKLRCFRSGVYDLETASRVRALQKRLGAPVTGILDRDTAEALGESPVAGQTPSWYVRALFLDDCGDDVAELRRMLGLSPSACFDEEVDQAVRRFQSSLAVTPNGVVDVTVAIALGDDVPLSQT